MGIGQLSFAGKKDKLQVTASIGCATLQPSDDTEELVSRADTALYVAKDSGRNRVISDLDIEYTRQGNANAEYHRKLLAGGVFKMV